MGSWTTARNSSWVFGGFLCVSFFNDARLQHVVLDLVSWHHRVRDGRVCWRPRHLRLEDDSTDSLSMCLPTVGEACQTTWILFSIEKVAESLVTCQQLERKNAWPADHDSLKVWKHANSTGKIGRLQTPCNCEFSNFITCKKHQKTKFRAAGKDKLCWNSNGKNMWDMFTNGTARFKASFMVQHASHVMRMLKSIFRIKLWYERCA